MKITHSLNRTLEWPLQCKEDLPREVDTEVESQLSVAICMNFLDFLQWAGVWIRWTIRPLPTLGLKEQITLLCRCMKELHYFINHLNLISVIQLWCNLDNSFPTVPLGARKRPLRILTSFLDICLELARKISLPSFPRAPPIHFKLRDCDFQLSTLLSGGSYLPVFSSTYLLLPQSISSPKQLNLAFLCSTKGGSNAFTSAGNIHVHTATSIRGGQ